MYLWNPCKKVYCCMPLGAFFLATRSLLHDCPFLFKTSKPPAQLHTSFGINDPGDKMCRSSDPAALLQQTSQLTPHL